MDRVRITYLSPQDAEDSAADLSLDMPYSHPSQEIKIYVDGNDVVIEVTTKEGTHG